MLIRVFILLVSISISPISWAGDSWLCISTNNVGLKYAENTGKYHIINYSESKYIIKEVAKNTMGEDMPQVTYGWFDFGTDTVLATGFLNKYNYINFTGITEVSFNTNNNRFTKFSSGGYLMKIDDYKDMDTSMSIGECSKI